MYYVLERCQESKSNFLTTKEKAVMGCEGGFSRHCGGNHFTVQFLLYVSHITHCTLKLTQCSASHVSITMEK